MAGWEFGSFDAYLAEYLLGLSNTIVPGAVLVKSKDAVFLRSSSTTVMSVLILTGEFDSTCLDAYTSLFIGATIVCGGICGIFNWFKLLFSGKIVVSGRYHRHARVLEEDYDVQRKVFGHGFHDSIFLGL